MLRLRDAGGDPKVLLYGWNAEMRPIPVRSRFPEGGRASAYCPPGSKRFLTVDQALRRMSRIDESDIAGPKLRSAN